MQPYFFPYLGYFELIADVDLFVIYDTPQHSRHGWTHRNRVLRPDSGWQYIGAPLRKQPLRTTIADVELAEGGDWRARLLRQLDHYRRRAPHFEATRDLVERALAGDERRLARLNVAALTRVCEHLRLPFPHRWCSELALDIPPEVAGAERVLRIAELLGATRYVNLPGGVELYDPQAFASRGIELSIRPHCEFTYETAPYRFEPGLSIVDVLMWNHAATIHERLCGSAPRTAPSSTIGS